MTINPKARPPFMCPGKKESLRQALRYRCNQNMWSRDLYNKPLYNSQAHIYIECPKISNKNLKISCINMDNYRITGIQLKFVR